MFIKLYLVALSIFFALDIVWLGVIAKSFYAKQLGSLMKTKVGWPAGIIFYLIFIAGLIVLVISPALEKQSLGRALALGAIFGLCSYATYDLTNLATLKGWPITLTIVDLTWGSALTAVASVATYLIGLRLSR